jgi:hypothetical protein
MVQSDPLNDPDTFKCQSSERIQIVTTVDKAPLLALFPVTPVGGPWSSVVRDMAHLTDTRIFVCPAIPGNSIYFNMSCDEQIAAGDPDPTAHYRISISSLTNAANPVAISNVNVPQGLGPIARTFTFNV